ncbi:MAG TPA: hypothetical protein VEC56_12425 [Candidatus Krumholzibacteria bacterium]|nr:hypothetical protein [Candidatus Krumholzibacteria bacterium]
MFVIRTLMIIALALMTAAVVIGCSGKVATKSPSSRDVIIVKDEPGPPDHAPAHGHRKKQGNQSVILEYDERMDLYVVSGYDDCYYTAGQFYRKVKGAWEWSVCIDGPWKAVAHRNDLPPGLRKHKA